MLLLSLQISFAGLAVEHVFSPSVIGHPTIRHGEVRKFGILERSAS